MGCGASSAGGSSADHNVAVAVVPATPSKPPNTPSHQQQQQQQQFAAPRISPPLPVSVLTDSYKASHYLMYPDAKLMVAYGEFRAPFDKDASDSRVLFFGMRYIVETYLNRQWTEADVESAALFYSTHNAGYSPYPFPKDLFLKFVHENRGYFPVRLEALREGTVMNAHTPVYQIFARGEYARLITFLETILTQVWYPSTVATLSRRTWELISHAFDTSVDDECMWLLNSRLHDFGFRGCTCVEQSVLGGMAHLLNFEGSDTMSACYYAQMYYNHGKPVATSIPATEHSVMTSWRNERAAILNMIDKFGGPNSVFAIVMDSYDYTNALNNVLPSVADAHKKKGGLMVLRPDSGDPIECIIDALKAGEKCFGVDVNKKGYKVIRGMAAIQGDGINYQVVKEILDATLAAGFSAQNVAFGMGGGLLQKVNRDTMSFATKLSYIEYADGSKREIMKRPKTDGGKTSLPGVLRVARDGGKLSVYPTAPNDRSPDNELVCVYDNGPRDGWDTFDAIRERASTQWKACPKLHDPISAPMKQRIAAWVKNFDENYHQLMNGEIQSDDNKQNNNNAAATTTATPLPPKPKPSPPKHMNAKKAEEKEKEKEEEQAATV